MLLKKQWRTQNSLSLPAALCQRTDSLVLYNWVDGVIEMPRNTATGSVASSFPRTQYMIIWHVQTELSVLSPSQSDFKSSCGALC